MGKVTFEINRTAPSGLQITSEIVKFTNEEEIKSTRHMQGRRFADDYIDDKYRVSTVKLINYTPEELADEKYMEYCNEYSPNYETMVFKIYDNHKVYYKELDFRSSQTEEEAKEMHKQLLEKWVEIRKKELQSVDS